MTKLVWRQVRGGYRAVLSQPYLVLAIEYELIERTPVGQPRWNVYVLGRRLPDRYAQADEAMRVAEREALYHLETALEKLKSNERIIARNVGSGRRVHHRGKSSRAATDRAG